MMGTVHILIECTVQYVPSTGSGDHSSIGKIVKVVVVVAGVVVVVVVVIAYGGVVVVVWVVVVEV